MNYSDEKVKRAGKVVQSFIDITKAITRYTKLNADSLGLTLPQMGILNVISYNPEISLKEIVEKLYLPKSTVSVNVDDLVKLELIERKASEYDRREVKLKVTEKGMGLAKKSCDNALSYKAMILALEDVTEDDINTLLSLHEKILADLH
jgi:Transcriptional regulators